MVKRSYGPKIIPFEESPIFQISVAMVKEKYEREEKEKNSPLYKMKAMYHNTIRSIKKKIGLEKELDERDQLIGNM